MSVSSLGYIGLQVQDMAAWQNFATDVLGLMPADTANSGNTSLFRMDDHPFRLWIESGSDDRLIFNGWEFDDASSFEACIKRLEQGGANVTRGDSEGATARCVTEYASSVDPDGNPFEIYHGRTGLADNFSSPLGIDHFVTGDMGMGHVVIPAPQQDDTHRFYKDVMGFGDSDDLSLPPPAEGAPPMRIVFMHASNPRHHSLALFNYPVPVGIVHLIVEMPGIDEVGACLDRVEKAGLPLMATLGRHCNDNMLSFYVVGPGGIAVEVGCEGRRVDWATEAPTVSTQADFWGHAYQTPEH